ncbi:MAG: hypothetical protein R6V01_00080 [Thermoplasmatota archaeon]
MEEEMLVAGVEEDPGDVEYDIPVIIKCPFCPRQFEGERQEVEETLFHHLWRVHEEDALEYILSNMYIPREMRELIFTDMGPEYVSWLVDTSGEILDDI